MKMKLFYIGLFAMQLCNALHILVVVDTFPGVAKTPIINQIIGLLKNHTVTVYSQKRPHNDAIIHDAFIDYNLDTYVTYDFPENLNHFDVIICQYGELGNTFAELKKEGKFTSKLVTFFRGEDITGTSKATTQNYKLLFEQGDLFLPICNYFEYKLILLGCPQEKICVVPSGVDCDIFQKYSKGYRKKSEDIKILSVGRLITKKGLRYAIEAISLLKKEYPNVKYIIVGNGPLKEKLSTLVKELKLTKNVAFLGYKTAKEIAQLMAESDIVVVPSVTSVGGNQDAPVNVLKEAMAVGVPVISTFHGGIPELVDNDVSGFLVPEANAFYIYKRIKQLIEEPDLRELFIKNGKKKVKEKYDCSVVNKKLQNALDQLF